MIFNHELSSDFIISALILSKFQWAKLLCEIIPINNKNDFTTLYGIANIGMKNISLAKNIVLSPAFCESVLYSSSEALTADDIIELVQGDLLSNSSHINLFLKSN